VTSGPDDALWRGRLLAARSEVVARVAAHAEDVAAIIAASDGANSDDEHDPEGATIAFERAQALALGESSRRRLEEVDAALARLDTGQFGRCVVCGRVIDAGRLAARLTANTCIGCAGSIGPAGQA
jgi:DnaK suppressor protein